MMVDPNLEFYSADMEQLLIELSDYFDGKQDCEIDQDGYHPNAEMGFYLRIKALLEGTNA